MRSKFKKNPMLFITKNKILKIKNEIIACPIYKKFKEQQKRNIYILLSTIILFLLYIFFGRDKILLNGYRINRTEIGKSDKTYDFYAILENEKIDVSAVVSAKRYTKKTADEEFKKVFNNILISSLGNNKSYENIIYDLDLKNNYGKGIDAEWKFIPNDDDIEKYYKYISIVNQNGIVNNKNLSKDEVIEGNLEVSFSTYISSSEDKYKSEKYLIPIKIKKRPISQKEHIKNSLLEEIKNTDLKSQEKNFIELPNIINGEKISYREKFDFTIIIIPIFGILLMFLLIYRDKYNMKKEELSIKQGLSIDYPQLITKTLLYVGAGMSIRNTLIRISDNYNNNLKENKTIRVLPIKLEKMKMKLLNGISELTALYELSKEIDDRNYTRFFNILIQNIKNGNKDLKLILEIEMDDALYERKMNAKKLAEEASTKLILPLIMIFGIIMAVIIIPAFMNI